MVLAGQIVPSCFPAPFLSCRLLVFLLLLLPPLTIAQFRSGPSSVSVPASWNVSKPSDFYKTDFDPGINVVLCKLNSGPSFFFGFNCFTEGLCYFGVYIFQPTRDMIKIWPRLVWDVSQENAVEDTVQLVLTREGELVLLGDDRKEMWSSNTAGKSVVGLNLTEVGNLVLYDRNDAIVWQSFDHPAHAILPKQVLRPGMKLTGPSFTLDLSKKLVYTFAIDDQMGFVASVRVTQSPRIYYRTKNVSQMNNNSGQVGALYENGTFGEFRFFSTSSAQYIGLLDGKLVRFVYDEPSSNWKETDLLGDQFQKCDYPLGCGEYGICLFGSDCVCPSETKLINTKMPSAGCNRISPFSCASHSNTFVKVESITHFLLLNDDISADIPSTTVESCKEECLRKGCSCTMALFSRKANFSGGDCYFLSDPFSLMSAAEDSTVAFIKVKKRRHTALILGTTVGAVSMFLVSVFGIFILSKARRNDVENDDLDLPKFQITRFRYKDLKAMTEDFNNKLGEGGFGSVFLGTLPNGVRIAVKRLEGIGHIKKSFLAEAETIGTIHHINLVRLLGFCAEKSQRLLVYEYMCNGSLDKWIFHNDQEFDICWQVRMKIILDIAKGLTYLHEDCHQKIIHLDIKPQNILLDEHFNAKLADFGLSKLIDKDQSHVKMTMRGTPGYLAPEWLSSVITEKVDVYSFGIVMLEVLCGRKNVDRSLPSDEMHLLTLFKCKAEQERLVDMLDKSSGDIQLHAQEATKMMKIATWCLQDDCSRRPPMSQVVKCIEGSIDIEEGLSCSFSIASSHNDDNIDDATQLLPSQLSGPR